MLACRGTAALTLYHHCTASPSLTPATQADQATHGTQPHRRQLGVAYRLPGKAGKVHYARTRCVFRTTKKKQKPNTTAAQMPLLKRHPNHSHTPTPMRTARLLWPLGYACHVFTHRAIAMDSPPGQRAPHHQSTPPHASVNRPGHTTAHPWLAHPDAQKQAEGGASPTMRPLHVTPILVARDDQGTSQALPPEACDMNPENHALSC